MIKVNLNEAKEISHTRRRNVRDEKMKPLDIEATIPALAEQAEFKRQTIRDANAQTQISIDNAIDEVELKQILADSGLIK